MKLLIYGQYYLKNSVFFRNMQLYVGGSTGGNQIEHSSFKSVTFHFITKASTHMLYSRLIIGKVVILTDFYYVTIYT